MTSETRTVAGRPLYEEIAWAGFGLGFYVSFIVLLEPTELLDILALGFLASMISTLLIESIN